MMLRKFSTDTNGDLTSNSRLHAKMGSVIIDEEKKEENEEEKEQRMLMMTRDQKYIQDLEDMTKKDLIGIMLNSKVNFML